MKRVAWLAGVMGFACQDIAPPAELGYRHEPLWCSENADCPGRGRCDPDLSLCVARERDYDEVLLEVVPQSTDLGFGGARLFRRLSAFSDTLQEPAALEWVQPSPVSGTVRLAFDASLSCHPVPVRITLTPREAYLGLSPERYSTISQRVFPPNAADPINQFRFTGVPIGTYDVHWEDAGLVQGNPVGCDVVPYTYRGLQVSGPLEVEFPQVQPRPIRVEIPWRDELLGWVVDVVHPVTADRISTQRVITPDLRGESPQGDIVAIVDLKLAEIANDYGPAFQEWLRIRPPFGDRSSSPTQAKPTILLALYPLITVPGGPAQIESPLETFEDQRQVEAWIWQRDEPRRYVGGRVEFFADRDGLANVPDGLTLVDLLHSTSIDAEGRATAMLPPGIYTARVYPEAHEVSAFETRLTVWGGESGLQGGRALEVPPAVSVRGRVRLPRGVSPADTVVQLVKPRAESGIRGDRPYSPRGVTALVGEDGRFVFRNVDCKACDGESGASYMLRVLPPSGSVLPWTFLSPIDVAEPVDLGTLEVGLPWIHFGQLQFRKIGGGTGPFPGVLIRAHVLMNSAGEPLPARAPSCVEATPGDPSQCAVRSLVVAETRSANDGSFRLLLPSALSGSTW